MINQIPKKFLLKIPVVKNYINNINKLRDDNHALKSLISSSRSPGLFQDEKDFLTERLMAHPVKNQFISLALDSISASDTGNRVEVAERLIKSYHKALEDEISSPLQRIGEDLWTGLIRNELPELMDAIDNNDPEKLARFLTGFGTSYVWFGGITTCIDGYNKDLNPSKIALTYHDKLVSLAESLGVICLENPECGSYGENLKLSPIELAEKIENKLNINITPPMGIIHTDGISIGDSLLHYRHINALYSATRLHKLNKNSGAVCEYGGGLGLTAMYSRRFGINDYTIFDLPITCLLAGHYLIHAVGEENISLYGEELKINSIKLLPYWECQKAPDLRYTFALNQDGFPEMSDNLILEYLKQIKRTVSDGFFSINHEYFSPRTVSNFVMESGGFSEIYRSKCWVREGYIEELFDFE